MAVDGVKLKPARVNENERIHKFCMNWLSPTIVRGRSMAHIKQCWLDEFPKMYPPCITSWDNVMKITFASDEDGSQWKLAWL